MVIYVEWVLFDNFCLDFLLAYLTLSLTKGKVRGLLLFLSAAVGSGLALLYPLCADWGIPFKIGALLLSVAAFSRTRSWRGYLKNLFVYALLSFGLSGAIFFLLGENMRNGLIGVKWSGAVGLLSISALSLVWSVRQISGLILERKREKRFATAELINRGKSVKLRALFDSGNLLIDREGKGIVLTDRKRTEELGPLYDFGEMKVNTAVGSKILKLVKIPEIKIYYENSENIMTNVTAALSDLPEDYALILPYES